jgi:hypothetical protein
MPKIAEPAREPHHKQESELLTKIREFLNYKTQIDKLTKASNEIKGDLMEAVELSGEEDTEGHYWLQLPEEISGYTSLQRQRRVTKKFDMEEAERILKERGLYEDCVEMVPMVNEEKVLAALYTGKISEDEIDSMYPKTISWAFVPSKR